MQHGTPSSGLPAEGAEGSEGSEGAGEGEEAALQDGPGWPGELGPGLADWADWELALSERTLLHKSRDVNFYMYL